MCSLPYPLQLNNRLDYWPSSTRLPRGPGGANVHVPNLAYTDNIVILNTCYREMQCLIGPVNRHVTVVGMHINASKAEVMAAVTPDEQRQAVLLDGEPLVDVRCKQPGHRVDQKQDDSCPFRILPPAILSLVTA